MKTYILIYLFLIACMPFVQAQNLAAQAGAAKNILPPATALDLPADYSPKSDDLPVRFVDAVPAGDEYQGLKPQTMPGDLTFAQPFTLRYKLPDAATLQNDRRLKDFEILAAMPEDKDPSAITLTVMPFNLNKTKFPQVEFALANGQKVKTAAFDVNILPAKLGIKKAGLIDIHSPYRPFNWWLVLFAFVAIGAVVLVCKYIFSHKKGKPMASFYGASARPLHIIALEQINNLIMQEYWQNAEYKLFYIDLINILRDYLSARFNIDAHQYTSRDLIQKLKNLPDFKADLRMIMQVQKSSDLVKFAKLIPSDTQRDTDIAFIKDIIIATKQDDTFMATPTTAGAVKDGALAPLVDIKQKAVAHQDKGGKLP